MELYDSESDSDMENAFIEENFLQPRRKKPKKQQVLIIEETVLLFYCNL